MTKTTIWTLTLPLTLTLALASAAGAAATDEHRSGHSSKCQKSLSFAGAKYRQCLEKQMGKFYGGGDFSKFQEKAGKCVDKYTQRWPKLVGKFAGKGTSCEGDRYVDNLDGTFYDGLTRLTWEEKTDDGSIHDKDDTHTWAWISLIIEDGTVFTTFLNTLNLTAFGGSSGWRLPSQYELYTLVEPGYPNCTASPCTTVPGDSSSWFYWSSSNLPFGPTFAWLVDFNDGDVPYGNKFQAYHVRAVRGGS